MEPRDFNDVIVGCCPVRFWCDVACSSVVDEMLEREGKLLGGRQLIAEADAASKRAILRMFVPLVIALVGDAEREVFDGRFPRCERGRVVDASAFARDPVLHEFGVIGHVEDAVVVASAESDEASDWSQVGDDCGCRTLMSALIVKPFREGWVDVVIGIVGDEEPSTEF